MDVPGVSRWADMHQVFRLGRPMATLIAAWRNAPGHRYAEPASAKGASHTPLHQPATWILTGKPWLPVKWVRTALFLNITFSNEHLRFVVGLRSRDMKTKKGFPALAKGQLWKMQHAYVQIVELGKKIIHFKMMKRLNEAGVRTQVSAFETLYGYLQARRARLVSTSTSD